MRHNPKESNLLNAIVLALILLAGTGLFYWQAGFFDNKKEEYIPKSEYLELLRDIEELKIKINNLEVDRDNQLEILKKIVENEKTQNNINELKRGKNERNQR